MSHHAEDAYERWVDRAEKAENRVRQLELLIQDLLAITDPAAAVARHGSVAYGVLKTARQAISVTVERETKGPTCNRPGRSPSSASSSPSSSWAPIPPSTTSPTGDGRPPLDVPERAPSARSPWDACTHFPEDEKSRRCCACWNWPHNVSVPVRVVTVDGKHGFIEVRGDVQSYVRLDNGHGVYLRHGDLMPADASRSNEAEPYPPNGDYEALQHGNEAGIAPWHCALCGRETRESRAHHRCRRSDSDVDPVILRYGLQTIADLTPDEWSRGAAKRTLAGAYISRETNSTSAVNERCASAKYIVWPEECSKRYSLAKSRWRLDRHETGSIHVVREFFDEGRWVDSHGIDFTVPVELIGALGEALRNPAPHARRQVCGHSTCDPKYGCSRVETATDPETRIAALRAASNQAVTDGDDRRAAYLRGQADLLSEQCSETSVTGRVAVLEAALREAVFRAGDGQRDGRSRMPQFVLDALNEKDGAS